MSFDDYMETFAGRPVEEWTPESQIGSPAGKAYRVGLSYDEADEGIEWRDRLSSFLDDPAAAEVEALVVGAWGMVGEGDGVDEVVETLVVARERLPRLKALFVGDITMEESEISWIQQGDVSPLFSAFPQLEHFGVRGGNGLSLGTLRLPELRSLVIESGGLPAEVVREVAAADLPKLEHLELWLGEENYGASYTVEDLQPVLSGEKLPALRYLGLRNSMTADQIAAVVATAPILQRIETLDLSMGALGDEGAAALLKSPAVARLKKLNVEHHYMSDAILEKMEGLGPEVNADEQLEAEKWDGEEHRYIAVGE